MKFDILIKGGEVVDPDAGYSGPMDVAIKRNHIAAVERAIPVEAAFKVIDATGQYVTPGLIDLHSHIYWQANKGGVHADSVGSRTGVTTFSDAGSAGALTLPGFREFIVKPSESRIHCFLNISSIGLAHFDYELTNLKYCDVDLFSKMVDDNRDLVVGLKIRMGASTVGPNGIEPMRLARQAADACELPMLVHIAQAPPAIEEILALMKPGDILSHSFARNTMRVVDDQGRLLDAAKRAWDAGVVFDVGHGAGAFSWQTAEELIAAGHLPDTISTDIHQLSLPGPMFDLPTCLSKFLYLGLSLPQVIRAATSRPAQVLGLRDVGTLRPGAFADIALLRLVRGRFPLYDPSGAVRQADQLLYSTLTILNGRPVPQRAPEPRQPFVEWGFWGSPQLHALQRDLEARGHTPAALLAAALAEQGEALQAVGAFDQDHTRPHPHVSASISAARPDQ